MDMIVVNVPDPAMIGNAIGTILPDFAFVSPLKNSKPKTISNPKINRTIDPAIANELMSSPNKSRNCAPIKKKSNMSKPDTKVACHALIVPILFLNEINTGIEPRISMTANNAKVAVNISLNEIELLMQQR